ncbi:MAG: glycosyltransferase [Wenzhouxiangellaceae bacterium]|nr:glycosyltransferase [Wenzhouxiangellaceae bacterium]
MTDRSALVCLWAPGSAGSGASASVAAFVAEHEGPVVRLPGAGPREAGEALEGGRRPVLERLAGVAGSRPVFLLRHDLDLPAGFAAAFERAAALLGKAPAVAFPGSAPRLDPLADLDTGTLDLERAMAWAGDRRGTWVDAGDPACLLVAPECLRGGFEDLRRIPALLVDDVRVSVPGASSEAPEDPVLGHVRLRIASLASEGAPSLPDPETAPVTLHIVHGWGGGVWRWVDDFIDGDPGRVHLVLQAVSSGRGSRRGRLLRLCAAGTGRGVIREWPLQPQIGALADGHAAYREILDELLERFGVGRIVVSSLIGHALDCLRTGLPTLQVLHDFMPAWPLLDHDPGPLLDAAGGDRESALAAGIERHGDSLRLGPADAGTWNRTGKRWRETVAEHGVALIAPTRHVVERWQALFADDPPDIDVVPHGFRRFDVDPHVPPPGGGDPLHLVVLGRLTRGKGLDLVERALPGLTRHARLTALGCGADCATLMGRSGIDLVSDYERDRLPEIMRMLKPDAVLLPSTVPETWSYALSEVFAMGLVPLASDLGSFRERIRDGEDGLLFRPEPAALVERVAELANDRDALAALAGRAPAPRSVNEVVADVDGRLAFASGAPGRSRVRSPERAERDRLAGLLADARAALDGARRRAEADEAELERRAEWARGLRVRVQQRTAWAQSLERDVEKARTDFTAAAAERDDIRRRLALTQQELASLRNVHEQVVASRSWRMTRPLRVAARVARTARSRGVLNPLRWPGLAAALVRNLRLRGLAGTLRMAHDAAETPSEARPGIPRTRTPEAVAGPVHFARPENPVASVVIPVYNQLHYTAACLQSLVEEAGELPFEILVVDDASTDETRAWLGRCEGIRTLFNDENLGFIGTCNRGAAEAAGEFVVFLNNDTTVTAGWLEALLSPFADPSVGVTGARLVYPDGSLQEAGGIVFDDASGWNYGRGDDPGRPQYNFVSDCDYVSGACLASPRGLFDELGGFDRHFAPAYYEDTDLCFRVREIGRRVVYQPAATVVHFEGVTSGTDESSGTKRYQAINREKFLDRWRERLADHPPPEPRRDADDPVRHARFRRRPRRALVIDAVTPMPDHDSGSVRMFALLRLLDEMGYQTTFAPENLAWAGRHSRDLQQAGIEVLHAPYVRAIDDWLAEHGPALDLVLVSRHYVLGPLLERIRRRCPRAAVIFDTVDLHFLREEREAELSGTASARRQAERTREAELKLVRACDATLVVSPFERDLLRDVAPGQAVHVVSNIHALADPGRPFERREDLLFVGGFQHPPNQDAARWLIDEILPRIRAELPDVDLHLIGSRMPDWLAQAREPGLRVHGFVEDLEPFLSGCRISLAPLRYGAGVKGKVNQAMSHGLPVVATPCAAEGMYAVHEHDILVADGAEAFAREVVRLYGDAELWQRLADNGRENVDEHFSVAAAQRALADAIDGAARARSAAA